MISILIDGTRLQEIVHAAELPSPMAKGRPELAGEYAGLPAELDILWPSHHVLAEPEMARDGRTWVLGCVCGVPGCRTLAARIDVYEETVQWSDWPGWWDLPALGILVPTPGIKHCWLQTALHVYERSQPSR